MAIMEAVDYSAVRSLAETSDGRVDSRELTQLLEDRWLRAYRESTPRMIGIVGVTVGTFEYTFDDYGTLEAQGIVPADSMIESRLVYVCGHSNPQGKKRDDYRLKGWIGRTGRIFGKKWDKGHFIGNALGGAVDRLEMNVFVQRRDLNRGWSEEGKRYTQMERYCAQNPGTFCFSRPIYLDESARPAFLEFGLLRSDGELLVERFDNRE